MLFDVSAVVGLHAVCAMTYGVLSVLIMARKSGGAASGNRTGRWLAAACLATAVWAASVAVFWGSSHMGIAAWLELARTIAWYGFLLHLYRQTVTAPRQMMQAFTTMGLLALLLVGGWPLSDALFHRSLA